VNVGKQIVIKKDRLGMPWLVDFDKNKIEASSRRVEKKLEEEKVEPLIRSEILSAMAARYKELMGGTT